MKKHISLLVCVLVLISTLALVIGVSAAEPASDVSLKGYQLASDDSSYNFRIIGELKNYANYKEVGLILTNVAGATKRHAATSVFQTLNVNGFESEVSAAEGDALFALNITGAAADNVLIATVTPYAILNDGTETEVKGEAVNIFKANGAKVAQLTNDNAVAAAYSLDTSKKTEYLPGTYTLTGVVSNVVYQYSATNDTMTVDIIVNNDTEHPVQCYKMTCNGVSAISVGDTVTVTGSLMAYYTTIEFATGCTLDSYTTHTHTYNTLDNKCDICGGITEHTCVDADTDSDILCDLCGVDVPCTECVDADSDTACDRCGGYVAPANTHTESIDFTVQGYTNGQSLVGVTINSGNVSYVFAKGGAGNPPAYYNSGTSVRVYSGGTLTISVPAGLTITRIEFTFGEKNDMTPSVGTLSSGVWTGEATEVTFTAGSSRAYFQAIEVTFTGDVHEHTDADSNSICDECQECITHIFNDCDANCSNPECDETREVTEDMHAWNDCVCSVCGVTKHVQLANCSTKCANCGIEGLFEAGVCDRIDDDGDNVCDACGATLTAGEEISATLELLADYRTEGTTSQNTYNANGFTVINAKGSSTNACRQDADHVRLYKSSVATFKFDNGTGITKLVITATAPSYATALANSINNSYPGTAVVNDTVVTVTFTSPVTEVTFTLSAQARIGKVVAYGIT